MLVWALITGLVFGGSWLAQHLLEGWQRGGAAP